MATCVLPLHPLLHRLLPSYYLASLNYLLRACSHHPPTLFPAPSTAPAHHPPTLFPASSTAPAHHPPTLFPAPSTAPAHHPPTLFPAPSTAPAHHPPTLFPAPSTAPAAASLAAASLAAAPGSPCAQTATASASCTGTGGGQTCRARAEGGAHWLIPWHVQPTAVLGCCGISDGVALLAAAPTQGIMQRLPAMVPHSTSG
jgi:hypothetical protein